MRKFMIGSLALALAGCGADQTPETTTESIEAPLTRGVTVYTNGTIHTGVTDMPTSNSITVGTDGNILAVSPPSSQDWSENELTLIDLNGAHLYPGLVDGHVHLLGVGQRELMFNLEGTASIGELVTHLESELQGREAGRPLYGRGWIETGWPEGRMPTAADLDAVSPDHPVVLERSDGHAVVANTAALRAAGIHYGVPDPEGGKIERDAEGVATGILVDNAAIPAMRLFKRPTEAEIEEALEVGTKVYASRGWTGAHNMSVGSTQAKLLAKLDNEGRLPIRVYNALEQNASAMLRQEKYQSARVTNRAVKLYLDGALGSRGAQLLEPYSDRPDSTGLSLLEEEKLRDIANQSVANGTQLAIHAIGDKANRRLIEMAEDTPNIAQMRWRIEHTQILAADDVERMAKSGLIASMQPSHAIGDLFFAPDRLGKDRLIGAYAWRDILDAGGIVVGGTDAPVEVGSPVIEFYAAVARKSLDGFSNEDWHPRQAVTRQEALAMFTSAPAYASFSESTLGTLEVGKVADFTVFDRDLMTVPEADILKAKVVMTVVGGEVVYEAK